MDESLGKHSNAMSDATFQPLVIHLLDYVDLRTSFERQVAIVLARKGESGCCKLKIIHITTLKTSALVHHS